MRTPGSSPSLRDAAPRRFLLGEWTVEPAAGRLSRPGAEVRLKPKSVEVLLALAAAHGDVVGRDDLFDLVWPDVIVTDSALNRTVSELRHALGDDAHDPVYIETISKVGYRLLVPVTSLDSSLGDGAVEAALPDDADLDVAPHLGRGGDGLVAPPAIPSAPPRGRRGVALGAAGVVALVLAAAAWWASRPAPFTEAIAEAETRVLTTIPGSEQNVQLSPDGRRVAFVTPWPDSLGAPSLYVQSAADAAPFRVAEAATWPAWAPDGHRIAFLRPRSAGGYAIHTVTEVGTDERLVADDGVLWGGLAWTPDGAALVHVGRDSAGAAPGLFVRDARDGSRRHLTQPETFDFAPAVSPDGSTVAFLRDLGGGTRHVLTVPLAGGEPTPVVEDAATVAGLAWTPRGDALVVSSNRTGLYQLWEVAPGQRPVRLAVPTRDPGDLSIAADGTMAVSDWRYDTDVWTGPVEGEAQATVVSTARDEAPALSPSGDRLAFVSDRSGARDVWVRDTEAGMARRLTDVGGPAVHAPRWSPDGTTIAFQAWTEGGYDVFVVSAGGGAARAISPDPASDVNPRWSADGQALYFGSERGGAWDVWRAPVTGGPAERVTTSGAFVGEEDPAGEGLYVMYPERDGLYRVAPGTEAEQVVELAASDWNSWGVTEAGLFAIDRSEGAPRLVLYDREGVPVLASAALSNVLPAPAAASVSADGRTLAWGRVSRAENEIVLVETRRASER